MTEFTKRLQLIAENPEALQQIGRGVEREALRFTSDGQLSDKPHPKGVGSALTNKWITTDFAESLLEFITPVSNDVPTLINQLEDIHHFTLTQMGDEKLWPLSMPCFVGEENDIQLADYGSSNVGKMKTVYRQGLKNRYGSVMQIISGVHFNFSFPDSFWQQLFNDQSTSEREAAQTDAYFGLIRNYYRFGWLIPYFFGASPALCGSFVKDSDSTLPFEKVGGSLYLPYSTSLRMSDLGYTNNAQSSLNIGYNNLDEYLTGLNKAINTPSEEFSLLNKASSSSKFEGEHVQLNSNVLQIENELYSPIRPKRVARNGEKPSEALGRAGIEYIEVRSLDVNPYSAIGITEDQVRFLDLFLIWGTLTDSDLMDDAELECWRDNWNKIILEGRKPGLELQIGCRGERLTQKAWAERVFSELKQVAVVMDAAVGGEAYQLTCQTLAKSIEDPELTISGQLLKETIAGGGIGSIGCELAAKYRQQHLDHQYKVYSETLMKEESKRSNQAQSEIEKADVLSFDEFLTDYFSYLS